jgi:hypothetical protein
MGTGDDRLELLVAQLQEAVGVTDSSSVNRYSSASPPCRALAELDADMAEPVEWVPTWPIRSQELVL